MPEWTFGRAPRGGLTDPINNRFYRGGELLPFYVPRPVMPQLNEEDYHDFVAFLAMKDIAVDMIERAPDQLRAHQHIDPIKAERMTPDIREKPIWISADDFILDGNHRWLAHVMDNTPLDCLQIGLPFDEAIDVMFAFPRTYKLETNVESN